MQAGIIMSFKNQTDYLNNVQSTVSKLYDPKEIEKLVKAKTENVIFNVSSAHQNTMGKYTHERRIIYSFVARSTIYLSDAAIEELLKWGKSEDKDEDIEKFVRNVRTSILEIRSYVSHYLT